MSDKRSSGSSGIGFNGLLQISFIVLKLCHVINWSWWWILCPTWGGIAIIILIIPILFAAKKIKERKRK